MGATEYFFEIRATKDKIKGGFTETWLDPGDCDDFVIGGQIPNGYRFLHSAREERGGGVGLLFKSLLKVKQNIHGLFGHYYFF